MAQRVKAPADTHWNCYYSVHNIRRMNECLQKAAGLFLTWLWLSLWQTGKEVQLWLCSLSPVTMGAALSVSLVHYLSHQLPIWPFISLTVHSAVISLPKSRSVQSLQLKNLLMVACYWHKCLHDGLRWVYLFIWLYFHHFLQITI